MKAHLISWMLLSPLLGAVAQALLPGTKPPHSGRYDGWWPGIARWFALTASLFGSLIGFILVSTLYYDSNSRVLTEVHRWIGVYSIEYSVGIDGINCPLILLISLIFPLLILADWGSKAGERGIHGLYLLLQASLFGMVCAQNLFLIFFFWAFSVLPFYFLIAVWGENEREQAAFRFIIYSSISNALIFITLTLAYFESSPHTFSIEELSGGKFEGAVFTIGPWEAPVGLVAFLFLFLGLVFRVPIWPVNGWFHSIGAQASPYVLVALCGVFVPTSIAVIARVGYELFLKELSSFGPVLLGIGGINVILGALRAISARELRLFLGAVCQAQVGLILMGYASIQEPGVLGAVFQVLAGGIGLSGIGFFIGLLRRRQGHTWFNGDEGKARSGGIIIKAPILTFLVVVLLSSLLGFPGVGGFVGQALVVIGAYAVSPWFILFNSIGTILLSYGVFHMFRHIFLGMPVDRNNTGVVDLTFLERVSFLPMVVFLVFLGVYPRFLLDLIQPSVLRMLSLVQ